MICHLSPDVILGPTIGQGSIDSARQNLSASFVNGLVNAAFGKDKLMMSETGNDWLYKNKEHGQTRRLSVPSSHFGLLSDSGML